MTTALVGIYIVIGLIIARLVISAQPEETTRGLPALAAAVVMVLLWPLAVGAAMLLTAIRLLARRRGKD